MANATDSGTIFSSPIFVRTVLPFLLVFTVVFAVLQKSEIFGKDKKQIDAIVALVIGLIVISFSYSTDIIVQLMPFLAVALVILLVFFILWGFAHEEGKFEIADWVKWVIGGVALVAVIIAVLVVSGGWNYLLDYFSNGTNSWLTNVIFIIIIGVGIAIAVGVGKKKD